MRKGGGDGRGSAWLNVDQSLSSHLISRHFSPFPPFFFLFCVHLFGLTCRCPWDGRSHQGSSLSPRPCSSTRTPLRLPMTRLSQAQAGLATSTQAPSGWTCLRASVSVCLCMSVCLCVCVCIKAEKRAFTLFCVTHAHAHGACGIQCHGFVLRVQQRVPKGI